MTAVSLEGLSKTYPGGIVAVDRVSLRISSGELFVILGPSGCGKSSLLRIVAGVSKPDHGRVYFDDRDLQKLPRDDRGIGMVFQEGALAPHWKSRKTIGFYLDLRKRGHELSERLDRIVEITGFGMDRILDRKPDSLSGGERQRVAIARALARDLKVLLLDEPFANLDAVHRREARLELKKLLREFPTTTIYLTHDQEEAAAVGDRIAVMMEGKIRQVGTCQQLHDTPVDLEVAEFIGVPAMNRFDGRAAGGVWRGAHFGGYPIRRDLPSDMRVILGIRPEGISLVPEGRPGIVEQVTPYLAERKNLIELSAGSEQWRIWSPMEIKVKIGASLSCEFDLESILYFDADSGKRIGGAI